MIDQKKIARLDTHRVFDSIQKTPLQIKQVIADFKRLKFPNTYRHSDLVAISGMGGSIYNYNVILSLFDDSLNKPFVQVNGYSLPKRILKDTVFIASSYSGSTEETLSSTKEAIKNDDAVTAVTSGGALADLMKRHKLPFYHFEPHHNPSGQPRCGLGYMVFGPILLLNALNYLDLDIAKLEKGIAELESRDDELQKRAIKIAAELKNKLVIFITAEHLAGAVHIVRNQLNETSKSFAEYHLIPELNHHLMEGLTNPPKLPYRFVFYSSSFFDERNSRRIAVTKKVLSKQGIEYIDVSQTATSPISEFLLTMQLNSYISFFLGIEYNVNPGEIPWVDFFKKQLAK